MKFFCVYAALLFCAVQSINGRPQFGFGSTQKLTRSNGRLVCDSMECPAAATKCRISKETTPDLKEITHKKTCLGSDDEVLKEEENVKPNPNPGSEVSEISEMSGSSSSFSSSSGNINNDTFKKIQEDIQKKFEDFDKSFGSFFNN